MSKLYILESRLSGWSQPSLVCPGAMPWVDQRVRAREPVGALSRDAQAPPFNAQAGLDVETLRPRVLALGLVSAVAGMPGRDSVGKTRG